MKKATSSSIWPSDRLKLGMPRLCGLGTGPGSMAFSAGGLRSHASSASRLKHLVRPALVSAQFSPSFLQAGVGRRRSNLAPAKVVRVKSLVRLGTLPDTWLITGGYTKVFFGFDGSVMPV